MVRSSYKAGEFFLANVIKQRKADEEKATKLAEQQM
jgi:hypothetical protein